MCHRSEAFLAALLVETGVVMHTLSLVIIDGHALGQYAPPMQHLSFPVTTACELGLQRGCVGQPVIVLVWRVPSSM